MVQYSICASLSVTADGCADTVFQQCVCVPLYTAAEKDRLSFKHMPSTSSRLQSSRGNKEEVRQKASPWLQATVEAGT